MCNAHERKNTAQKNPTNSQKKNHRKQQQLSKSQKSEYESEFTAVHSHILIW